ncbi:terminase [Novosphingobium sp. FSY-8]|uniref:Terminase n=1 Tax=Novosphingobium ovatum TaxID=1908523 RepID=A0ABW9XAJ1_9SPHN|nr:phage terminase small subunit [Novosphingobium ovatum]NBC35556.1 terminase [Novosphingobium ovatum]
MVSPFRRHQMHVRGLTSGATVRAASIAPDIRPDTPQGLEYAALRVALHDQLRTLHDIQSIEARNPKKREYAQTYADWIDGVLTAGEQAGTAAQDEILITNMIWAIDYRDLDYALALATHAIRFNLAMPERFKRSVASFVAEQVAELALATAEAVTLEQLMRVAEMIDGADMHDPIRAKLYKAIARAMAARADTFDPTADNAPAGGKAAYLDQAMGYYTRAAKLDPGVGVKKDIQAVERAQKALAKEAAS